MMTLTTTKNPDQGSPLMNAHLRTADLYQRYALFAEASFWVPIFFIYFASLLPLEEVLWLEGLYFLCVVVVEVPSGWIGDRIGRRPTLLAGAVLMACSHLLLFAGPWLAGVSMSSGPDAGRSLLFWLFAGGQGLRAAGLAFRSGTDTAMHHDSLEAAGQVETFAEREARAGRNRFLGGAGAALIGGAVAWVDLRLPYLLSFFVAIAMFMTVFAMREPNSGDSRTKSQLVGQAIACTRQWANKGLLLLFGYVALMLVLNHIPYEYFQPYIESVLSADWTDAAATPMVTGVHVAITFWLASMISGRSIRLRNRIGLWGVLACATALQALTIGLMAFVLSPLVVGLLLLRSCPRGLMTPPLNAAVTGAVPVQLRATYLSMQSLAGRLAFGVTLFLLAMAVPAGATGDWAGIREQLAISTWIGGAGLGLVLLVLVLRGRRDQTPSADATSAS
jgi:MFS family permease